ncbi:hypothetical protein [Chryseobacterium sp.]|nr:hypothetical protein [Chryseobacterium sp.]
MAKMEHTDRQGLDKTWTSMDIKWTGIVLRKTVMRHGQEFIIL